MSNRLILFAAWAGAGCALLTGCASRIIQAYPGSARPLGEISMLTAVGEYRSMTEIMSIDGTPLGREFNPLLRSGHGAESITVLPGTHLIQAIGVVDHMEIRNTLRWSAVAGHAYGLRIVIVGYRAGFEIVDESVQGFR